MNKKIVCVAALAALSLQAAHAGGKTGVGGGGDIVVQSFIYTAKETLDLADDAIFAHALIGITEQDVDTLRGLIPTEGGQLAGKLDISSEDRVYLRSENGRNDKITEADYLKDRADPARAPLVAEKDAINDPPRLALYLGRLHWLQAGDSDRLRLAFHELLAFSRLDDSDYAFSDQFLAFVQKTSDQSNSDEIWWNSWKDKFFDCPFAGGNSIHGNFAPYETSVQGFFASARPDVVRPLHLELRDNSRWACLIVDDLPLAFDDGNGVTRDISTVCVARTAGQIGTQARMLFLPDTGRMGVVPEDDAADAAVCQVSALFPEDSPKQ